jgi:hypothetical protein
LKSKWRIAQYVAHSFNSNYKKNMFPGNIKVVSRPGPSSEGS